MADLSKRNRKVDLEKLSPEEAERIGEEIGKKAGEILSKAEEDLNKLFKIYGQKIQVAVKMTDEKSGKVTQPLTF